LQVGKTSLANATILVIGPIPLHTGLRLGVGRGTAFSGSHAVYAPV
jgi:hypothetical protein